MINSSTEMPCDYFTGVKSCFRCGDVLKQPVPLGVCRPGRVASLCNYSLVALPLSDDAKNLKGWRTCATIAWLHGPYLLMPKTCEDGELAL